jgi:S-methylmethionine-dependent homocysteine/selenocysteine methylase
LVCQPFVRAPDVVKEIHHQNIEAGAQVITTNSYWVILADLAKIGIEHQYDSLNELAGKLAIEYGRQIEIAASLPPQNDSFRPDLVLDRAVIEPLYRKQAELLQPYVDLFLCETMSSIAEAVAAAAGVTGLGKPVYIGLTLHDEMPATLLSGESLKSALEALASFDDTGVLGNCSLPERISDAIPVLAAADIEFIGTMQMRLRECLKIGCWGVRRNPMAFWSCGMIYLLNYIVNLLWTGLPREQISLGDVARLPPNTS